MSTENKVINNSLTELAAGVKIASLMTGGSTLSSYGTIAHTNNYSLITQNRPILTYLYTTNGIMQTAIELPVQDALRGGLEIESSQLDVDDIEKLNSWLESPQCGEKASSPLTTVSNTFKWARLYGGAGIVINDGTDPTTPINLLNIKEKNIAMYDLDRWQINYRDMVNEFDENNSDFFYVYGQKIHKSRLIAVQGKRAPYHIRRQLQGWGMSEAERMIRDLNLFFKTQDVLYEIIDESKIDVYKINGLAGKLLQRGGSSAITDRIMLANEIKSHVNALVLDSNEEFQQKQVSFSGLAEVQRENRIGVCSALRMPITKLFGMSASGFSTGEADLENYNSMVESDVRTPMRPLIRKMLEVGMYKLFGFIPEFKFSYKSLRLLSAVDEEGIKTSQSNRAIALYDRGIIESQELAGIGKKEGWLNIETKAGKGEILPQPSAPNNGNFISQGKSDV